MAFRIFTVRLEEAEAVEHLNAFLSSRRVLNVERRIVRAETDPAVVFVVEYLPTSDKGESKRPPKVDYRELLSEAEFEVFSSLRQVRSEVAQELGRPVYTVFSNAELAAMVQGRLRTREGIRGLSGVGEARVEQFAERFLPTLEAWAAQAPSEPQEQKT
jgi:superfamily II DNA helicase RecQ